MFISKLKTESVRLKDPYVAATVAYLSAIPVSGDFPRPVKCFIAGGIGVRCYAPIRPTNDLDVFFEGGKVIVPPNTTISVKTRGEDRSLHFDHQYTPSFGLLHEDFDKRAVPLARNQRGRLRLFVLHPVDLALSKVLRFEEHDRRDIAALAKLAAFDVGAFMRLGEECVKTMIGNQAFARLNLKEAGEIVAGGAPQKAARGKTKDRNE
jgi:hypothetical protein